MARLRRLCHTPKPYLPPARPHTPHPKPLQRCLTVTCACRMTPTAPASTRGSPAAWTTSSRECVWMHVCARVRTKRQRRLQLANMQSMQLRPGVCVFKMGVVCRCTISTHRQVCVHSQPVGRIKCILSAVLKYGLPCLRMHAVGSSKRTAMPSKVPWPVRLGLGM